MSTPVQIMIGVAMLFVIVTIIIAIVQPNLLQFQGKSNQSIFNTLDRIGDLIP